MYVVLGPTGHTGSVVAEALPSQGQSVRVVVRTPEKGAAWKAKGTEVAVASYEDRAAITKALTGVQGVYLLSPPNYAASAWLEEQRRVIDQAAQAVKESGIAHVVFLSSEGAQLPEGTGPILAERDAEARLGAVAKNVTFLRPAYFFENWAPVLGVAKEQGLLPTFIPPDMKIPMISTQDIGRIAAEQLMAGPRGHQVLELSGPESYSPGQVAAALSQLFKRPVTAQLAPLSEVVPTFKSFGFSDEAAALFEEMYRGFANGSIVYEYPESVVRGVVTLPQALSKMAA
jgi:uncharacterized protein YbjT (DUF2867 family)